MSKYITKNIISSPRKNNVQKDLLQIKNNIIAHNNIFHEKNKKEKDKRLTLVLIKLGLSDLQNLFNEKNISFMDLLLLTKESMKELKLQMYQRNRIFNFSKSFIKFAKDYSMEEISDFFNKNKKFYFMKKSCDNSDKKNKIKNIEFSPNVKSYNSRKIFKKYLLIKKDVDEFLNKLNKQKEDSQCLFYKYSNFLKQKNNYIINERKSDDDDIAINEEKYTNLNNMNKNKNLNKLYEKIKNLGNKNGDIKENENFNKIKNYVNEKGENMMDEEIFKLINGIDKMTELNNKKEKLKFDLEIYQKKINENKNLINQFNNESGNSEFNN